MPIFSINSTEPNSLDANEQWSPLLIALTMLMVPALGVPSEELLQDTFKSIILALGTLVAGFIFLWLRRDITYQVVAHPIIALPIALSFYALGSIFWSHAFLAGVEAIRWIVLAVLLFLVINCSSELSNRRLAYGVHIGLIVASFWVALQFWFDFSYFPQGPNPASTFVNRNFYAEYAVAALPLSVFLIVTTNNIRVLNTLIMTVAFNVTALLMTGTRSALVTLSFLLLITIIALWRYWPYLRISKWSNRQLYRLMGLFFILFFVLGSLPTQNKKLVTEFGTLSPIERAFSRTASVTHPTEYSTGSFSIRSAMWKATLGMIQSSPIAGIGAGAWEVHAPLYQTAESKVEADFYAHNEFLQLIAEYGVVGWICVLGLGFYLIRAMTKIWKYDFWKKEGDIDAPLQFFSILSILALLIVSNAGFPFRLASTGGLFIASLGLLVASDLRSAKAGQRFQFRFRITHFTNVAMFACCALMIVFATYVSALAIKCESSLVRAVKLALTITSSGQPNNPHWDETKVTMLDLLKEGMEINPHYRKLTPMVADELASWGDWANAIWIWDSVLQSRPNVIALSVNIAKGYFQLGDFRNANTYLKKAEKVQPSAPLVQSMQALIWAKEGNYLSAIPLMRQLFNQGFYDYDLIFAAYAAGNKAGDLPLMVEALQLRLKNWPEEATDAWMKLGDLYSRTELKSDEKATFCYQMALQASPTQKESLLAKMPSEYQNKLRMLN